MGRNTGISLRSKGKSCPTGKETLAVKFAKQT